MPSSLIKKKTMRRSWFYFCILVLYTITSTVQAATDAVPLVASYQKISEGLGDFTAILDGASTFGAVSAAGGDLNNDGFLDIVMGKFADDEAGSDTGAIFVIFLSETAKVLSHQKISKIYGGLTADIAEGSYFGSALDIIPDLNSDGMTDLVVGANEAEGGDGAVFVIFLDPFDAGSVFSHQKISTTSGKLSITLTGARFGSAVACPGDVNMDQSSDVLVGGDGADSVYLLFLTSDGTVLSEQQYSVGMGGFTATYIYGFGIGAGPIGDMNNDRISEVIIGSDESAVTILFISSDGLLASHQRISSYQGGLSATIDSGERWGVDASGLGDVNLDGNYDVVVGADGYDGSAGAVYILLLCADGTVQEHHIISSGIGEFTAVLDGNTFFGKSVAGIGDFNHDGVDDLLVGSFQWDKAAYIISLHPIAITGDKCEGTESVDECDVQLCQAEGDFGATCDINGKCLCSHGYHKFDKICGHYQSVPLLFNVQRGDWGPREDLDLMGGLLSCLAQWNVSRHNVVVQRRRAIQCATGNGNSDCGQNGDSMEITTAVTGLSLQQVTELNDFYRGYTDSQTQTQTTSFTNPCANDFDQSLALESMTFNEDEVSEDVAFESTNSSTESMYSTTMSITLANMDASAIDQFHDVYAAQLLDQLRPQLELQAGGPLYLEILESSTVDDGNTQNSDFNVVLSISNYTSFYTASEAKVELPDVELQLDTVFGDVSQDVYDGYYSLGLGLTLPYWTLDMWKAEQEIEVLYMVQSALDNLVTVKQIVVKDLIAYGDYSFWTWSSTIPSSSSSFEEFGIELEILLTELQYSDAMSFADRADSGELNEIFADLLLTESSWSGSTTFSSTSQTVTSSWSTFTETTHEYFWAGEVSIGLSLEPFEDDEAMEGLYYLDETVLLTLNIYPDKWYWMPTDTTSTGTISTGTTWSTTTHTGNTQPTWPTTTHTGNTQPTTWPTTTHTGTTQSTTFSSTSWWLYYLTDLHAEVIAQVTAALELDEGSVEVFLNYTDDETDIYVLQLLISDFDSQFQSTQLIDDVQSGVLEGWLNLTYFGLDISTGFACGDLNIEHSNATDINGISPLYSAGSTNFLVVTCDNGWLSTTGAKSHEAMCSVSHSGSEQWVYSPCDEVDGCHSHICNSNGDEFAKCYDIPDDLDDDHEKYGCDCSTGYIFSRSGQTCYHEDVTTSVTSTTLIDGTVSVLDDGALVVTGGGGENGNEVNSAVGGTDSDGGGMGAGGLVVLLLFLMLLTGFVIVPCSKILHKWIKEGPGDETFKEEYIILMTLWYHQFMTMIGKNNKVQPIELPEVKPETEEPHQEESESEEDKLKRKQEQEERDRLAKEKKEQEEQERLRVQQEEEAKRLALEKEREAKAAQDALNAEEKAKHEQEERERLQREEEEKKRLAEEEEKEKARLAKEEEERLKLEEEEKKKQEEERLKLEKELEEKRVADEAAAELKRIEDEKKAAEEEAERKRLEAMSEQARKEEAERKEREKKEEEERKAREKQEREQPFVDWMDKYITFISKMEEFERKAKDPNRFKGSSRILLEQDKFRKHQWPRLAKLQVNLRENLESFEQKFNYSFTYNGRNCLEDLNYDQQVRFAGGQFNPDSQKVGVGTPTRQL